jgi:hypothetical protein
MRSESVTAEEDPYSFLTIEIAAMSEADELEVR